VLYFGYQVIVCRTHYLGSKVVFICLLSVMEDDDTRRGSMCRVSSSWISLSFPFALATLASSFLVLANPSPRRSFYELSKLLLYFGLSFQDNNYICLGKTSSFSYSGHSASRVNHSAILLCKILFGLTVGANCS